MVDTANPCSGREFRKMLERTPTPAADIQDGVLGADQKMPEPPVGQRGMAPIHDFQDRTPDPPRRLPNLV
jgi:hypothetical protein